MKNISLKIDGKLRPILNTRYNFFDSVRICNLFENRIDRVFSKLYRLDVAIHENLKQNIYDATEIRERKR